VSRGRIAALALMILLRAAPGAAHDRTTSFSSWELRDRDATVRVTCSALDVSRFPWASEVGASTRLGDYLVAHLGLSAGGARCPMVEPPASLPVEAGRVAWSWRVRCPDAGALRLESDLFVDVAPGHLHFARLARDGGPAVERVLSERERVWALGDEEEGTVFGGYVHLGTIHILSGADHLAFLAALLLIGADLPEVVRVVTGFTVAHSLTLALAVLGWVRPERAPIEALIGLSVALVAAENVWLAGARRLALPVGFAALLAAGALASAAGVGCVPPATLAGLALFTLCYFGLLRVASRTAPLRWAVAFLFGLVHGFGFASVLAEARLDPARLARALVGFNVGVELGQLAVVAALWPLIRLALRVGGPLRTACVEIGSAAVLALGVFWFLTRAYG
jgi:hypothetical protein